jgi:hypothetical protein
MYGLVQRVPRVEEWCVLKSSLQPCPVEGQAACGGPELPHYLVPDINRLKPSFEPLISLAR